jgi:hypothetical protein
MPMIQMEPSSNESQYMGWAAAILLLVGWLPIHQLNQSSTQIVSKSKNNFREKFKSLKIQLLKQV